MNHRNRKENAVLRLSNNDFLDIPAEREASASAVALSNVAVLPAVKVSKWL